MQESLIVVGNGMAALRTLEELTSLDPDRYRITVYGAEPHAGYNRIQLSSVLAGEKLLDQIITHPYAWYAERGIELKVGTPVTAIDRANKRITDSLGNQVAYDRLLLATGSHPVLLPLPGRELPGVLPFRDALDVERMLAVAQEGRQAVVIGGGLLGLEAAMGLLKQGMEVTVVHLMACLMERQLDEDAAGLLKSELESRGLRFKLNAESAAILGERCVTGLQLKSGEILPADLVVMAVGIKPNADLARAAGIDCNRGVVVDDCLTSSDPAIVAVGECAEHRGVAYGLVAPLFAQGKVLARHLAGVEQPGRYEGSTVSTRLKVTGVEVCSAGEIHGGEEDEILIFTDPARRIYKKLIVHNERIRGMVLLGDARDGPWYLEMMQRRDPITPVREHILFGHAPHLGDAGHGPSRVVHLSDDHEVCGCNGVKKGRILEAISRLGLTTVEEVRTHTKASGSCGSCTGSVEQLLAAALGGDYVPQVAKPLCGCTTLTSDAVREAVRDGQALPVRQVMAHLGWSSPDGCPTCRQAIHYYLTVFHPASHREERSARFVNERYHANIQKDGTYSVVPRIFGGVTAARELKILAELVERFAIPEVKFTGGQRLTLLGIRREQLPTVWGELARHGMVSGHAYGKAVRTVKTCVGSRWCRFGTQDSEALGVELEKQLWNSWTPHKVKLAVSGCPRNCAEATIKDVGVVGVDSGWEIHVGGNGGIKVRVTDLLVKVATTGEVQEWSAAFLQLYRREARYLERTATWMERVGIDFVREALADPVRRLALATEFQSAHAGIPDPWQEGSEEETARHFAPLAIIGHQTGIAA